MTKATENGGPSRKRGIVATALFPPVRVRFVVALLLTFFPLGLLYPLDYPAGELLTLCCWIWVFPSPVGCLSLGLLPLIPGSTCGYFAFNLFCLIATLAIASSAFRSREFHLKELVGLHKFARICMAATLGIAAVQSVTDPYIWISVFSNMRLESGRGAGLKFEPSQLASLLALHLLFLTGRAESMRAAREPLHTQMSLFWEGIWAIVATLALTRSFTVLIVAACFAPALFLRRRHLMLTLSAFAAGVVVGVAALGDRIGEAVDTSGGSMTDLITESVGSWRNVPDFLILSNLGDFLVPGSPAEVRIKITTCAVRMSPALVWIQNTFSTFSAAGVTVGLLATAGIFIGGITVGLKGLSSAQSTRLSWLMMYFAAWFFMAKWDPSAWIVLGLLPLMHKLNQLRPERRDAGLTAELQPGVMEP